MQFPSVILTSLTEGTANLIISQAYTAEALSVASGAVVKPGLLVGGTAGEKFYRVALPKGTDALSIRLAPADADSLFASKDFQQSMQLYDRPAHGGHTSATQQFGKAGEAALGNLAIMGVAAAITGHLPDGH